MNPTLRCLICLLCLVPCSQVLFAQLTANNAGKVDLLFANNGHATLGSSGREYVSNGNVIKLPTGKILVLTNTWLSGQFCITLHRLEQNGLPDQSFGQNGVRVVSEFTNISGISSAVQKDGKILIVGHSIQPTTGPSGTDAILMRLNSDGLPDVSFGNESIVTKDLSSGTETSNDRYAAVTVRPDGKYFLAGLSDKFSSPGRTRRYVTATQFNPDGSIDNTFGTNGISLMQVGDGETSAYFSTSLRLRTLRDGRLAVSVSERVYASESSGEYEFFTSVLRYDQNGIDNTFSDDGRITFGTGPNIGILGGFDEDQLGKIVIASCDHKIRRFNIDGTLDSTFGNGGSVSIEPVWGKNDLAIALDGKIIVTGAGRDPLAGPSHQFFGIVRRYNSDGTPDIKFARMGKRSLLVGSDYTQFDRVTVDDGEGFLLLGTRQIGSNTFEAFVSRINGSRKLPLQN